MAIELDYRGISFERERRCLVSYRGKPLRDQQIDLIIENVLVVELKAIADLHPIHEAQLISYRRASKTRVGLLLNFNKLLLKEGIKRVVN